MRFAAAAKLRALFVIGALLVGVAVVRQAFPPPMVVGQEQVSPLPANWQSLGAQDFADLAEKYFLTTEEPDPAVRSQLIQHAWTTFLASDEVATNLDGPTLDRLLGIVNPRNPESLNALTAGLEPNQQAELLQRWNGLKTRSINATIAKLGTASSLADLLDQVRQMGVDGNPFALFSPEVGKQVGSWVAGHKGELASASTNDLLELLHLLKSRGMGAMAIGFKAWVKPVAGGTYQFTQLRHGALEGAMTISVDAQSIYDSSKDGANRFESSPVELTGGRRVLLEATYTYDPKNLIQVGKLPRDAGGRWPIFPVAAVMWKQGEGEFELIPDAAVTADAEGKTAGVTLSQYSDLERTELLFEGTSSSLGEINPGKIGSADQITSQTLVVQQLLKRDPAEMLDPPLKPVPESIETATETDIPKLPRMVYQPTIMTLIEALSPQQREELVSSWQDQPGLLAKIDPNKLAQLWKQVYLLPGKLPLELLVAWSDARTAWEETLSLEERYELMNPKGGSFDSACNGAAKQIAATMEGAYADRLDGVLKAMVDEDGNPRLPLVKIALQAGGNNYRLKDVVEVIDGQLAAAKGDGDRKALWMIADAYRIEAVEGVSPHPQAIGRLEEVSLVTEDASTNDQMLLETVLRAKVSQEVLNEAFVNKNLAAASKATISLKRERVLPLEKNEAAEAAFTRTLQRRKQPRK